MAGRGACIFFDGKPKRVAYVRGLLSQAGDSKKEKGKKKRYRKVKSEPLKRSFLQILEFLVCLEGVLEAAALLEERYDPPEPGQPGRKCEYRFIDAILFEFAVWYYRSRLTVAENLGDPWNWERLYRVQREVHPDRPEWWLSPEPISRSQQYRFRKRFLNGLFLYDLEKLFQEIAVAVGQELGIFEPEGKNSWSRPRQLIVGDGTFLPAMFKTPHWEATDPGTGEEKRSDPDASPYRGAGGEATKSPGYVAVFLSSRNPHGNERLITNVGLVGRDRKQGAPESGRETETGRETEAGLATDMYLELIREYPSQLSSNRAIAFDMAMRARNIDRILSAGRIAMVKVPYTNKGTPAEVNLGEQTFRKKGETTTEVVYGVNGRPCIIAVDGNGELWFVPLTRIQTKRTKLASGTYVFNGLWAMPKDDLTPDDFDGATTWIRHNSTPAECEAGPNGRHKRRTVGLSVIPESDPHFEVYGKREDAESIFSDSKARLCYGRCNTIEYDNVMFMLLAYQLKTIVTSLIAYQKRTETDISKWVGNYKPRTRGSPAALKAA